MNLLVIGQVSAGLVFSSLGGVYLLAPHWIGIYRDVYIYLSDVGAAAIIPVTDNSVTVNTPNATATVVPKQCWVVETSKHNCSIDVANITDESKNYIDATNTFTEIQTFTDTTGTTSATKYYKIKVSEKLLWELQKSTTKTISINITSTKKLTAIFAYDNSKILQINNSSSTQEQHYVGKAAETTTQTTLATGNKCAFGNVGNFQECKIFSLQTSDTTIETLDNEQFTSSDNETTTIKLNNWYLIKSASPYNSDISVKIMPGTDSTKTITIKDLKPAFVADVGGTKKLFHFAAEKKQ